jgi:hypothetical protein
VAIAEEVTAAKETGKSAWLERDREHIGTATKAGAS